MQLTLFERESRAPPKRPSSQKYRTPLEKHEVKSPWSKPDRNGNLFWEKMHKELEKLPEPYREFFNYITIDAAPRHLEGLEKCLRLWNKAAEFDRVDFDESRGRL